MKIKNIIITFVSVIALLLSTSVASLAKVVGDKIVLGAAVSLTGKYSSNGVHTQNGYNMAVDRINGMGGVKVGGKSYKFEIIYYDDESNPKVINTISACVLIIIAIIIALTQQY